MITGTDYPDLFHVDELFLLLKLYELVNMNKKARPPWPMGASGSEEEASPAGVCSHALRPGQGGPPSRSLTLEPTPSPPPWTQTCTALEENFSLFSRKSEYPFLTFDPL